MTKHSTVPSQQVKIASVSAGEAFDHLAVHVKGLNDQRPALGVGVDNKRIAQEHERLGGERSLFLRFHGNKSVETQRRQPDAFAWFFGLGIFLGPV